MRRMGLWGLLALAGCGDGTADGKNCTGLGGVQPLSVEEAIADCEASSGTVSDPDAPPWEVEDCESGTRVRCEERFGFSEHWYDSDGELVYMAYSGEETDGCAGKASYDLGACTPR